MLPEMPTVADTDPMIDHYSGPTGSLAETNTNPQNSRPVRSRKPNSLYPASDYELSTVRQKK